MQEEINLLELFALIKKHLFKMFVFTLVGAIVSLLFMNFFVEPKYQSSAQLLVNQKSENQQAIQYSEIQSNIQLINTYRDIVTSHSLLTQVSDNIGGVFSAEQLYRAITVRQSTNSQVFTIRVVLDNPNSAQTVLTELISLFDQTLRSIYQNDISSIYVVQPASLNPNPVSPSRMRYIAIGAIIGLAIAMLIALFTELLDNTVKGDDFLTSLGLTNLGGIYTISSKNAENARLSNKKASKRKE